MMHVHGYGSTFSGTRFSGVIILVFPVNGPVNNYQSRLFLPGFGNELIHPDACLHPDILVAL